MRNCIFLGLIYLLFLISGSVVAQNIEEELPVDSLLEINDTTLLIQEIDSSATDGNLATEERSNPGRALWKSAVIPGWGQHYNRQQWKSPIFLGAFIGSFYVAASSGSQYKSYNNDYINRLRFPDYIGRYPELTNAQVQQRATDLKGRRGLFTTLAMASYSLNVIDAYASAFIRNSNRTHIPAKSAYYSTLLPGLGQVYNKQWWKVPIFYAGLGITGYFVAKNYDRFDSFRDAYIQCEGTDCANTDYNPDPIVPTTLNKAGILTIAEYYRNNLDLAILVMAGVYVFNVIDATVFGHLHTFNVDDDLSWKVQPFVQPTLGNRNNFGVAAGWQFVYNF